MALEIFPLCSAQLLHILVKIIFLQLCLIFDDLIRFSVNKFPLVSYLIQYTMVDPDIIKQISKSTKDWESGWESLTSVL